MKFLKKITALLTVCIMAVAGFSVSSAADDVPDYMYLNVGDTITYTFPDYSKIRLMFDAQYSGELIVKYKYTSVYFCGALVCENADGEPEIVRPNSIKATKGTGELLDTEEGSGFTIINENGGTCECTVKYPVSAGTHLITLSNESKFEYRNRGGNITVSLSMNKKTAALKCISATLKKGSTLQLGAMLSDGTTGKATWTSSDKNIASVNSKGKVTAKKKGKAVITATYGSKKLIIAVVVK